MATTNVSDDPLIAALPPNTDYITYLTILEYQLTPQNLPTLNRLLQQDDGTLASEIGWDLLKLILPILRVEPGKARECLDIIARRGNPREVIVRVSEELETLGIEESDDEADPTLSADNIPTFAGEAPHVHLGAMTLAGMPPPENIQPHAQDHEYEEHTPDAGTEELKLQSLLSMLSSLHARIKTQYPSRFLATSLPAALGAYRRLSMNTESTIAFLNTLMKLSGTRRPSLPPRIPTADMLSQIPESSAVLSAPLPDPESKSEFAPAPSSISGSEQAINQRLLQAVLLEVLEEYSTASSEAHAPLTARLRMQYQPLSLNSTRKTELIALAETDEAKAADALRAKFIQASKNIKINVQVEIVKLLEPPSESPAGEEEHEYPTSPSQIPITATGLLLLHSAQLFLQAMNQTIQDQVTSSSNIQDTESVLQLLTNQYSTDTRLRQSGPALDYIVALLFTIFCTSPKSFSNSNTSKTLLSTFTLLKDIFTTCPDPDLRDNAHHIASHLLHAHFSPPAKLILIKDLLTTTTPTSPIHEAQSGTLKALAVSWLKDEIYPTASVSAIMRTNPDEADRGLPMTSLVGLADVLFPTTSIPDPPSTTDSSLTEEQTRESTTEHFSADLPFYIAALNLLCIFIKNHNQNPSDVETDADSSGTADLELASLTETIMSFLGKLEGWSGYLTGRLGNVTSIGNEVEGDGAGGAGGNMSEGEVDGVSLADVFALEDAVGRAREVVGEKGAA